MELIDTLVAGVAGLAAGGFATMLADRIPDATPLSLRSRCPECGRSLDVVDTLPVVGWTLRRGRCRHCAERVAASYVVVEVAVAALFIAIVARHGLDWLAMPPAVLAVALVALSLIDLRVYRLPDRLVFPALAVSAVSMVVAALAIDRTEALPRALVGSVGFFVLLLITHLISPRGMGFGDVKLALLLGLHLGWTAGSTYLGWSAVVRMVLSALMFGCLIGVALGLGIGLLRRRGRDLAPDPDIGDSALAGDQPNRLLQHTFPFGPALAAATMGVVLYPDLVVPT